MGIIIDLIIVSILALSIYMGYRKGLVNMIFKIMTFFLSLIISFVIYIPVTNFIIDNTKIDDNISTFIADTFIDEEKENVDTEKLNTSKVVEKYITSYTDEIKNEGIQNVAKELSIIIVKVGVFLIIFAVARALLFFVKIFANIFTALPFIKECNKTGGFVYGIIRGFIIVWSILALISILIPVMNLNIIAEGIEKSLITKILYDYNVLLMVLF